MEQGQANGERLWINYIMPIWMIVLPTRHSPGSGSEKGMRGALKHHGACIGM